MPSKWLVFSALYIFLNVPGFAWDDHVLITRLALRDVPGLDVEVPVEPFDEYLRASGFNGSRLDFLRQSRLNQKTEFSFRAGETPGKSAVLREILAVYAAEPDGGLDQDIFKQYPELWKRDYLAMGGNMDTWASGTFRHAYWPGGYMKQSFPFVGVAPLGEAPDRAQLFFDKSAEAFRAGHAYWGARFLAWALHYVQDVAQPFHTVQLPAPGMLVWRSGRARGDLTAKNVAYYHYAFEAYASRRLSNPRDAGASGGFGEALVGATTVDAASSARHLVRATAETAFQKARGVANLAQEVFPRIKDLESLNPDEKVSSSEFWKEMDARRERGGSEFEEMDARVSYLLGLAGRATRSMVETARAGLSISAQSRPSLSASHASDILETRVAELHLIVPRPP